MNLIFHDHSGSKSEFYLTQAKNHTNEICCRSLYKKLRNSEKVENNTGIGCGNRLQKYFLLA